MERNFRINPVGLKGNEINERMKQLMGVTPINENLSRSTVELTKIGPDGKAYGIVRENHEYYIKVSDKTSNLTVEDFKYIGGLQNKKSEAYSSYAKATKHLNLKFNSICESYDIVNTFNVFVDDNLLSEGAAKEATKHITDTKGKELGYKVKEEGGDNLASKKVMDEMEEVTLTEDELAIDAMLNESDEEDLEESAQSEIGQYAFEKTRKKKEDNEEEEELDEAEPKNNPWAICTASVGREDKKKYEACVRDFKKQKGVKEELKGNQYKIDADKNGKIDADDFKKLRKQKTNETWGEPNKINLAKTFDEWLDELDNADTKEILKSLYFDLGKPVVDAAKKVAGFIGGPDVRDAIAKIDANKKNREVDLDEEMSIEEIQEAIADLKKKL